MMGFGDGLSIGSTWGNNLLARALVRGIFDFFCNPADRRVFSTEDALVSSKRRCSVVWALEMIGLPETY